MRRSVRFLVGIILIVVALSIIDVTYGDYTATYECSGAMATKNPVRRNPIKLFIEITQYRCCRYYAPDGALRFEIPPGTALPIKARVFEIKRNGPYLNLHPWATAVELVDWKKAQGQFSTMSNSLILNLSDDEQFQGSCKPKTTYARYARLTFRR